MTGRVRVIGGPWPERIGCVGTVVTSKERIYPWVGRSADEVIVKLDSDPLAYPYPTGEPGHTRLQHPTWSCCINVKNLEQLP